MGNCWFLKYSSNQKMDSVSEPSLIKIQHSGSEGSIINPQNLHIDLILEHKIPANILSNSQKKDTEISIDSPIKSPTVSYNH